MEFDESQDIRELVRTYYGQTLQGSDDLKTDACCCTTATPPTYVLDVMGDIEDDIMAHFYGCGSPIPPALSGATVLDLGCGTGRDVYVCSKLVGPTGRVIGVDMTEQQLAFARRYEARQMERFGFAQSNVEFHQGYIEDLAGIGIEDESVDVVISNCVINLSPFKDQVFAEIARVLKPGGELYFSDIFSDRRVPPEFYDDPVLRGECLSGALYIEDFRRILAKHGIHAFYDVETAELHVGDFQIATKLGCIGFASHTVRAIKCADLEDREENYGQVATYLGTMPENKRYFDLTEEVRFIKGKPLAVSGNMAAMLSASRYAPHFEVRGTREHHVGTYDFASAQEALALRRGKEQVGLARLEDAHRALGIEAFDERVHDKDLLRSAPATPTMQVNVSYRCNLACTHCYLECGPQRTECMGRDTMEDVLAAFAAGGFSTLDVTGGSPETNPHLEWFVREASKIADEVIVRSNLAILDEPEYRHFMDVYTECGVHVVTSLPYFNNSGCDLQRAPRVRPHHRIDAPAERAGLRRGPAPQAGRGLQRVRPLPASRPAGTGRILRVRAGARAEREVQQPVRLQQLGARALRHAPDRREQVRLLLEPACRELQRRRGGTHDVPQPSERGRGRHAVRLRSEPRGGPAHHRRRAGGRGVGWRRDGRGSAGRQRQSRRERRGGHPHRQGGRGRDSARHSGRRRQLSRAVGRDSTQQRARARPHRARHRGAPAAHAQDSHKPPLLHLRRRLRQLLRRQPHGEVRVRGQLRKGD